MHDTTPDTIPEPREWRTERERRTFACDYCGAESAAAGWCARCSVDQADDEYREERGWWRR